MWPVTTSQAHPLAGTARQFQRSKCASKTMPISCPSRSARRCSACLNTWRLDALEPPPSHSKPAMFSCLRVVVWMPIHRLFLACLALAQTVFLEQFSHHVAARRRAHLGQAPADLAARQVGYHSTPWRIGSPAVNSASSARKFSLGAAALCIGLRPPSFFNPGLARNQWAAPAPAILGAPSWHPGQTDP